MPRRDGGTSETKTWNCEAFVLGPKEIITTVIFDGWDHTSQNEQVAGVVPVPSSIIAELTYSVTNYLKTHPEHVFDTISQILIS